MIDCSIDKKNPVFMVVFALLVTVSFAFPAGVHGQQENGSQSDGLFTVQASAKAVEAANGGLMPFLKAIPRGELAHYNFSEREKPEQAVLGRPFKVYTIVPDNILNYERGKDISEVVSATPMWFFPVVLNGEVRTLLIVDIVQGKPKAVAIGSSGLAREWASLLNTMPLSQGYAHAFVRVYQAKSDFMLMRHAGKTLVIPLASAAIALGLEKGKTYDPAETMLRLKKPVEENLKAFGSRDN
jgi:hypothetical protein